MCASPLAGTAIVGDSRRWSEAVVSPCASQAKLPLDGRAVLRVQVVPEAGSSSR